MEPAGPPARNAFGRPVQEEIGAGAQGSVAVATGMALSGLRATAFLRGDELASAHDALRNAADRLAPLVIHVLNDDGGHAGYHGVSGCGLFQVLPSSGQEAVDLTLVARWVTERALVPGLVATDGMAVERLRPPDEEMVRTYLGYPDEAIRNPTHAQGTLFGIERARMLRWFDPDRPVATGGIRDSAEGARARLGSRLFFWNHVEDLAREAMAELARLTGRPLSFVDAYHLDNAEGVLVAQGAAVQVAKAVAGHLRRARGWKLGVLGLTWLRPLPVRELVDALKGHRAVAVVEPLDDPLAPEPRLFRELKGLMGGAEGWISATYASGDPDPARLSSLCALLRGRERPHRIQLDRVAMPQATGFPRRDALLQSVANDYPELRYPVLPEEEGPGPDPDGGGSAGLVGLEAALPADVVKLIAEAVSAESGPCVRGTATRPEPGVLEVRVRAAPSDFADGGRRSPVSVLLVATGTFRDLGNRLGAVVPGGKVLIATTDSPQCVWDLFPPAWRRVVRESELRLFLVEEALEAGLEAVRACLRGGEAELLEAGSLTEVDCSTLSPSDETNRELPQVVRRIERIRTAHDSLPRFWGEVVQPRQEGSEDGVPDPLTATSVVPAGASALEPNPGVSTLPVLDPDACTGCGRCWTVCPDAAIGVTVLGVEALLTAASRAAGTEGRAADALRRAHKHLAGRLNGELAKSGAGQLTGQTLREGWSWLSTRMDLTDEDRPAHEAAFEATLRWTTPLEPVVTAPFFEEAEDQKKGAGELLVLAIDPRACLACNLCVSVCPEDALQAVERSPERISRAEARWRAWEELPDTSGETLGRALEHSEVGPMAGVLLSRHCAQAQVGGGAEEPGSGERLAGRLVAALVESHGQRRMARLVKELDEQSEKVDRTLRERLAEGLSTAALDTLTEALSRVRPGRAALSELGEELRSLGASPTFDRQAILRMAELTGELQRYRDRLAEGADGLGRARFGVVVADGTVADWAARFPRHPYYAPLTLAPTAQGVELARGIARGLVAEHLELVRTLRRAALDVKLPPDRSVQLEAIEQLTWDDLDAEDRSACPPLLLLGDESALLEHGFGAFTQLLASNLPVKVVLLDGQSRLGAGPEPGLVGMAHRKAFVLCGSLAYSEHLARGVADALAWPGPALVHLHAPSPRRHGFPAEATLERARLAVEGRAQILFRYDPGAEGLFGLRASLEGNPGFDEDWGSLTFAGWAAGEGRFAQHFEPLDDRPGVPLTEWLALPERGRQAKLPTVEVEEQPVALSERMARAAGDRLVVWNVLRELTGASSPFTERIRSALKVELQAEQQEQLRALQAEQEARIVEIRTTTNQEAVNRLMERLMTLAGYTRKAGQKGDGP
jgi:pyruvate-ferredoxin/flavodoxin oxidoreductase